MSSDATPNEALSGPIDVVLLTWNDSSEVTRAIEAVAASTGIRTNIWLVDNGSVPPFAGHSELAGLHRAPENLGVAGGRNVGARMGTATRLCLLDSDAFVSPEALNRLAEALERPGVGMAVPRFDGLTLRHSAGRRPGALRKLARAANLTDKYRAMGSAPNCDEVEFAIGACQLIRRDVFEGVGGLDNAIFYGPEDIALCDSVRAAGWKIVQVPEAVVTHRPRRRNRRLFTRRGLQHGSALCRFYFGRRADRA